MPPTPDQIKKAAARAAREYGGEQVILFGSQAHGTAGPHSDVDLLVLTPTNGSDSGRPPWRLKRLPRQSEIGQLLGKTPVHILLMSRADAEDARGRPGVIGGVAVEHGLTVHCEPGTTPLETGTVYWKMPGGGMVRKTQFRPDEAERLARRSAGFLRSAEPEHAAEPDYACILLQKAGEHMLKSLITAKGEQFEHTHNLNKLWDAAEKAGVDFGVERDREAFTELSLYAGELEYSAEPPNRPAAETLKNTLPTIRGIVEKGRRELSRTIRDTRAKLARTEHQAIGISGPTTSKSGDRSAKPTASHPRTGEPIELRPGNPENLKAGGGGDTSELPKAEEHDTKEGPEPDRAKPLTPSGHGR